MNSTEKTETYTFESWSITATGSHILQSKCDSINGISCRETNVCHYCRYVNALKLPMLPEMVFHLNTLKITYGDGKDAPGIEFNALDALRGILVGEMPLKIACADDWISCREETGFTKKQPHVFDWTYTTEYSGTIFGNVSVTPTELTIDMEKLKEKEEILFYQDKILFEDELHDNGIALLSVKMRVMPSGFFILLRYFLRIDDLLVRVIDTRMYYATNTNFIIRERSYREARCDDIDFPPEAKNADPIEYAHLLPIKYAVNEKLIFNP